MSIEIIEESTDSLPDYGEVSIAFEVKSQLRVESNDNGLGGFQFKEEEIREPYIKDADQIEGEGPLQWSKTMDTTHWGVLSAYDDSQRVGGAVVAWKTPGIYYMLEDHDDVAALWDIRIHPVYRSQGIGSQLLNRVADWARDKGCRLLKIETQNNNVWACRFYERQGCTLGAVNRDAYKEFPDEIQLIWHLKL